jgi:gliding motility-associated-like protein
MKKIIISSVILLCAFIAKADHITGGEMYYTFKGILANGEYQYSVTLKFFMRCSSGRRFYDPAVVSVFNKKTGDHVKDVTVALANERTLTLTNPNPCITNPPTVCYEVGYYYFDVSLPSSADGYKLASQVTFRIQGINNLGVGYSQTGATYTADIPGTADAPNGASNNGAFFTGNDLVIVCADNPFSYSFAATDDDGDQLRYSFCDAYTHTNGGGGTGMSNPPARPPYPAVPYGQPFSGQHPLGPKVNIHSSTGLISGTAPAAGVYVVTVCVEEIRNGVVIAIQRKDLQINIAPCTIAGALLSPEYMLCKNSKSIALANLSTSPLIKTYNWTILDLAGNTLTTSTNPTISYTFADTGRYKLKLVVNSGLACSDSTTSIARVYPGFAPDFTSSGVCFSKPTLFNDMTTSTFGTVNSWQWDFGELASSADTSSAQHPSYSYPTMGRKYTQLIVGNTVGCKDTLLDDISVVDKPPLNLGFRDTLICVADAIRLNAGANGVFAWSPASNIIDANTSNPIVSPRTNTTYYVDLNDNGCINRDSVKVRVTDHVDLQAMNDTTICEGDTIQLNILSNGFSYSWTPASQVIDQAFPNPRVVAAKTTTYAVTARIGGCSATESVIVNSIPYPVANAGPDTTICFETSAHLNANVVGSSLAWSPGATLTTSNQMNTVATPMVTTTYNLTVYDTRGCPKPGMDQVTVTVLPPIKAMLTGDTVIASKQPLQLAATGGDNYSWSPSIGLSDDRIGNPVATISHIGDSIRYKVRVYNRAGCYDSASVLVKIFKTLPAVFVPNAFTPDGDSKNDLLKPIAVGMKQIDYFKVYNRWGQLVFSTTTNNHGWDGTIKGKLQSSGMYVWAVKAIDYNGQPYTKKGTAILIR